MTDGARVAEFAKNSGAGSADGPNLGRVRLHGPRPPVTAPRSSAPPTSTSRSAHCPGHPQSG